MILLIIQYTILSLLLICIFHYLYNFFKNNLTVPKVKDLVNKPASAYSEIYETINKDISNLNSHQLSKTINSGVNNSNTYKDDSNLNMKDELKKYLSKLNSTSSDNVDLNSINNSNSNSMNGMNSINGMNIGNNMNVEEWGNYSSIA